VRLARKRPGLANRRSISFSSLPHTIFSFLTCPANLTGHPPAYAWLEGSGFALRGCVGARAVRARCGRRLSASCVDEIWIDHSDSPARRAAVPWPKNSSASMPNSIIKRIAADKLIFSRLATAWSSSQASRLMLHTMRRLISGAPLCETAVERIVIACSLFGSSNSVCGGRGQPGWLWCRSRERRSRNTGPLHPISR
jgi:hypothetical protein